MIVPRVSVTESKASLMIRALCDEGNIYHSQRMNMTVKSEKYQKYGYQSIFNEN